jgi:hypothetical protein
MATITEEQQAGPQVPAAGRRRGRRCLAFAAAFVAVVLGTEGAIRVLDGRLPEPLEYFSATAQKVANDLEVLARRQVRSDITFVGTSQMRRAVDANQVERELGVEWSHNVALPGAQTPVVERWLLEEVVPRIHPRRVVWGIQSIDFNAGRDNKSIVRYERARATEGGLYGELDRLFGRSAISRHREELRDPLELANSLGGTRTTYSEARPLGDRAVWKLGYPKRTDAQLRRMRAAHAREIREHQLLDFRVGSEEMAAYEHTLTALRERGIEVVVVIMPVPSGYVPLHPDGAADYEHWRSTVIAATERLRVPILDMGHEVRDEDFRDYEHLLMPAARRFATSLVAELRRLGW